MGLSLGLESLNNTSRGNVIPFSGDSFIRMNDLNDSIGTLVQGLENYWDAAKNAMTIRKALNQFGATASIKALVGLEGIQVARSFSMEGFWSTVKETLLKIWEKIKEWWNRFWGMFFSQKKAAKALLSKLRNGNVQLKHEVEFDGPSVKEVLDEGNNVITTLGRIAQMGDKDFAGELDVIYTMEDTQKAGNRLSNSAKYDETYAGDVGSFPQVHIRYRSASEVHTQLKALIDLSDRLEKDKNKFDKTINKAIKWLTDLSKADRTTKVNGKDTVRGMDREEAASYNEQIKNIKAVAAWTKKRLMKCLNAANGLIARIRAHVAIE